MGAHAKLSASSSKRWLNCPPSVRLEENFPDTGSSVYAEEGSWAHSLCEYKIKRYLHDPMERPKSDFLTEEIEQLTDIYTEFVIEIIEGMKRNGCTPLVLVEERLDYSHIAPSGFGTGDLVVVGRDGNGEGLIHICDFKTGAGVFVDADHNSQMMLYAIGALHAYGYLYDIRHVAMSIVQPRLENISTCTMSVEELSKWGESIKPIARLAYEGGGDQKPGDWCRFCKARAVCKACAEEALALAREDFLDLDEGVLVDTETEATDATAPYAADDTAPTFRQPGLLSQTDIEEILPTLNRISSWIEAVFAFVASEAINHGVHWRGYKICEGRSRRTFTSEKEVVDAAALEGFTDLYKRELMSLTEIEKLMGKKRFQQILGKFVLKPPGKLTLVPESDPRPAVDLDTAQEEFEVLE